MPVEKTVRGWVALALAAVLAGASTLAFAAPADNDNAGRVDCGPWEYGMGLGMMGGYGYDGGGSGMMSGYGGGPGMMGGYGYGPADRAGGLGLSDDQRVKVNHIQDETRKTHWALMGNIMDQQARLRDLYQAPKRDTAAIDDAYKALGALRQQMINSSVDAHNRIKAVLTSKQLDKLRACQREEDQLHW
ncbi:periplasmic heavy metal sensor [Paraburkholderia sp. BL10I2N1]|uniref:Spy/CpxP family protein refolding chaperone n=1 Tax=Paraburkholderia sp. BL10I2N1 TaxID=1938796 RepID=UPI00106014AF|nr:periplasmic heavy metal sensor [Paraburkholderia sp. BL10I2N1]TDN67331.1 Spy/CpxP family protein refolding chaperone [Paraburkholderia sp. BL10I2N1]